MLFFHEVKHGLIIVLCGLNIIRIHLPHHERNNLDSITHLLNILKKFASISGLQINMSKTEALWLGLWKDRPDTPFNFNYPQDPICALGVFSSYNTPEADKLNFGDKLCSIEKVLNAWKCRKLTLIGRINIAKL